VAAGRPRLAAHRLEALTGAVTRARRGDIDFGFNEWLRAGDGEPCGHDWQTWTAALYLYAAACVERGTPVLMSGLRPA
jgi:hypothetical protein